MYINDPTGYFTADELARIQDTINSTLLAPYSVTVIEVSDPSQATITIDAGLTSASGSAANGVLGCYNGPNNEITILEGWDWYAGADPTQIGAGQYDFQTVMTHELGHALGLGGSTVATSPMNEVLAAGTTRRTLAVADLNIPNVNDIVDPELAAPSARSSLAGLLEQAPGTGMASVPASLGTQQPARVPSEFTSDRGTSQVLFGMDLSPRMIVLSPPYRAGGGMTVHITFPSQDQTAAESTRWIGSWGWANGPSLELMARNRYDGSASPSLAAGLSAVMRDRGGSRAVSHSTWNDERWLEPERASGALPDSASLPGSESAGMLTQEAITDWFFAAVGIAATVAVPPALLSERRRQEQPQLRSTGSAE